MHVDILFERRNCCHDVELSAWQQKIKMEVLYYTIDDLRNIDYACMYDREDQEGILMKCVEVRMPLEAFLEKFPSFVYDKERGIVCKRKYLTESFIDNVLLKKDFNFGKSSEDENAVVFKRDKVIAGSYNLRSARKAIHGLYEGLTPWIFVTYKALLECGSAGSLENELRICGDKKINPYAVHSVFAKNKDGEVVYIEAKDEFVALESIKMNYNPEAVVAKSAKDLLNAEKQFNLFTWKYSIRPLCKSRFFYHALQDLGSEKCRFTPISGTEYLVQSTMNYMVFAADHRGMCYFMEPETIDGPYEMRDIQCWYASDLIRKDFYSAVTESLL